MIKKLLKTLSIITLSTFALNAQSADVNTIGSVSTAFKLLGPNHKVTVESVDDPAVTGVTCYVSRAISGGLKSAVGLAQDPSEASIACRQVGNVTINHPIPKQEEILSQKASLIFKHFRIVRMVDPAKNVLIYVVYFDRLVDGSPKNSLSVVPLNVRIPLK